MQSLSFSWLHPCGQQPSSLMHEITPWDEQEAVHVAGLLQVYVVHALFVPQLEFWLHSGVMHWLLQHILGDVHEQSCWHEEHVSPESQLLSPHSGSGGISPVSRFENISTPLKAAASK